MRLLFGILALLWAGTAAADDSGNFYAGLHTGVAIVPDTSAEELIGPNQDYSFDTGFGVGGYAGYRFGNGIRLEGEYTYRRAGIDDVCSAGICVSRQDPSFSGSIDAHSFMANLLYEHRFAQKWLPYVGGGAGLVLADVEVSGGNVGIFSADDSVAGLAFQFMAGVGYEINPKFVVSAGYTYWDSAETNLVGENFDLRAHNFMVGGRYNF